MLKVCGLHKGGKALIQPRLSPVLAGDNIAKPLVRELVGVQGCHGADAIAAIREVSRS